MSALYAVVELMGHRTRAGRISDAQLGGTTLLKIEHPTEKDHTGEAPLTEYYAASAIFSIRPCSEEESIEAARWWRRPGTDEPRALAPAFESLVDDIEDVDVDDDEDEF
jgi:hypothetical protein